MKSQVTTGDVTLAARPATAETFASFGKIITTGESDLLGRRGRVLLSLSGARPGPRRVSQLIRYPEARRAVIAPGDTAMWIVVLGAGSPSAGPPAAFTIPPGAAVVLDVGVWHSGPHVLEEAVVTELLEAPGGADLLDRVPLRELVGAEAARVILPDEPGAPGPGIDLTAPGAVLLDAGLAGKLRVGCLCMDELIVQPEQPGLTEELAEVGAGLRGMWSRVSDLAEVPGVGLIRSLFQSLGMDPQHLPPASERLLAEVLAGATPPAGDALEGTLSLCMLRMGVPMAVYDAAALAEQVLVRLGGAGESFSAVGGERVRLADRPVLCDRDGPFGSPVGDSTRTRASTATKRALVTLFLSPGTDDDAAEALLDGVERAIVGYCGGRSTARLIVG